MKHIFFILTLFFTTVCSATTVKFETVANTNGIIDNHNNGQYRWTNWNRDTTDITFVLTDSVITVNDTKYYILESPKQWHIMKDRKYVEFHCVNEKLQKTHIRIVEFDKKSRHFSIKVFGEEEGQMFRCRYVDK